MATKRILGISAFYHDSAAALVVDGKIVAAAQEERFTRIKHDAAFPLQAIQYCLDEAGCELSEIDYLVFYEKPLLKFDRLLETYIAYAPVGFRSFRQALPIWIKQKLLLPREIRGSLKDNYKGPIVFPEHHESHAASAFFPSPFEDAAILTVDGVGEWATTTIGKGNADGISMLKEITFPHSLGLLYSAFTYYTGFKVNSGEYKLMGLAPYGEPKYASIIRDKLIDIKDDGSFRMDMQYFNYCQGLTMTNKRFEELFGKPARKPESALEQFHMDIAASIQLVTEEIMLKMADFCHQLTGAKNLCLAGGVALNCVANGKILREGPFENVWIQPAAGDAGGALGAALFVWHQLLGNKKAAHKPDSQLGSFLGPAFSDDEIESYLDSKGADFARFDNEDELAQEIAVSLADEKVIGIHHGRMEFGPRALGGRSIIGDARSPKMQSVMNLKIKFRESFRPFAPCILREHVDQYFDMRPGEDSPYMLLVADVKEDKRLGAPDGVAAAKGLDKLNTIRSVIPAVTHVDNSARVQTIDQVRNPFCYKVIKSFFDKTDCPVIINTSFNVRGEPIVCTPADAYACFLATGMDVLVLGNYILHKDKQQGAQAINVEEYLGKFSLD